MAFFEFLKNLFLPEAKEKQSVLDNIKDALAILDAENLKNNIISQEEKVDSLPKSAKEEEEDLVALEVVDEEEEFMWFKLNVCQNIINMV